jgi:hypothetical protein
MDSEVKRVKPICNCNQYVTVSQLQRVMCQMKDCSKKQVVKTKREKHELHFGGAFYGLLIGFGIATVLVSLAVWRGDLLNTIKHEREQVSVQRTETAEVKEETAEQIQILIDAQKAREEALNAQIQALTIEATKKDADAQFYKEKISVLLDQKTQVYNTIQTLAAKPVYVTAQNNIHIKNTNNNTNSVKVNN